MFLLLLLLLLLLLIFIFTDWCYYSAMVALQLAFTAISFQGRWFNLAFLKNCDHEINMVVYMQTGICYVDHASGSSFRDCVDWTDTKTWEAIDDISHTETAYAASKTFPDAAILLIECLIISALSFLLCLYSIRKPFSQYSKLRQYLVGVLCIIYFFLSYMAGYYGSTTDITVESTWKPFTECTEAYAYPFTAYYALLVGFLLSGFITFVTFFPAKMWCFQLISAEEEPEHIRTAKSTDSGHEISMIDVPRNFSTDNPIIYKEFVKGDTLSDHEEHARETTAPNAT
jgi:hypothetical protein